jgi:hypothetical protein
MSPEQPQEPIDARLVRECRRVYRRYAIEIVEAFGFCPYAERSRLEGRTLERVLLDRTLDLDRTLAAVAEIAQEEHLEIGLLLFPRVRAARLEFARFVERLRAAHQRQPGGLVMAMEGFHPDAEPDTSNPARLIPFLRRTPDPTIQLVRLSVLERVRRGSPQGTVFFDPATTSLEALLASPPLRPLHERIAETNHATVLRVGAERIRAIADDILHDRDLAYAPLGEPPRARAHRR